MGIATMGMATAGIAIVGIPTTASLPWRHCHGYCHRGHCHCGITAMGIATVGIAAVGIPAMDIATVVMTTVALLPCHCYCGHHSLNIAPVGIATTGIAALASPPWASPPGTPCQGLGRWVPQGRGRSLPCPCLAPCPPSARLQLCLAWHHGTAGLPRCPQHPLLSPNCARRPLQLQRDVACAFPGPFA